MQKSTYGFDWDQLRIFLAVVRAGQFLGAARRLGVDQATVTRRIRALEKNLGVRLFDRFTTGSVPTGAGRELIARAERIEAEVLRLEAELSQAGDSVEGRVRVGAPDGFGTLFLASRFVGFVGAYPRVEIDLVPLPRSFSLSKREVDLAITVERPVGGRLTVRKLTDYTLSLYAACSYLAKAGRPRAREDLGRHRHVTYVPDLLFAPTLDFRAELGLADRSAFQCASVLGQMEAVRSGMGIGLLHDYAARGYDDIELVLPQVRFTRTYWIVTHADIARSAPVRAVHDHIAALTAAQRSAFVRDSKA
ncbi:MAG TPA: LysR family transcriptional regulator [Hyphomicrobiaceae bacterium]|nr:LysR family transcriptional regulator [Hyphomicrobiaceae bacterium]